MEFLKKSKVSGATVRLGVDGSGKSGKSTLHLDGLTINQPMIIDVVEENRLSIRCFLNQKKMVDGHGIITLHGGDAI